MSTVTMLNKVPYLKDSHWWLGPITIFLKIIRKAAHTHTHTHTHTHMYKNYIERMGKEKNGKVKRKKKKKRILHSGDQ